MKQLFLKIILIFSSTTTLGQGEEFDYLSLAQLLVKDGHYSRAEITLKKVSKRENNNPALYESLMGILRLNRGDYKESIAHFQQSLALGLKEKEIYLYISEAYLQLKEYTKAESNIERISSADKGKLPYYLIKAEIYWQQGVKERAFKVLAKARDMGLAKNVLIKKRFYYFLEEELYQSAFSLAFDLIRDINTFNDVLAMASQLRVKKQNELSLKILQHLQVLRPQHETVALEMAQNYLAMQSPFSAALTLERAAKHNNSLAYEAAELLRQVGKSYRARFLNLSTLNPEKRLKQKLALYLEDDDYFSLTLMVPQLNKYKMLENQSIRYAVAYSFFRTGELNKSESYLEKVIEDGLFEKSIELKKEILSCKEEKWACRETI